MRIPKILLACFLLDLIIIAGWLSQNNPSHWAVAMATITCGLLLIALGLSKQTIIDRFYILRLPDWLKILLLGLSGATVLETIFWLWEKLFGASGVAASPNILYDLLLTLPWYGLMTIIFWQVQKKNHYSLNEILFFGGIYELGADGLVGGLFKGNVWLSLTYGIIGFPVFITAYAMIMLPLAMLIKKINPVHSTCTKSHLRRYAQALWPLIGLIPFIFLYLLLI